MKQISIVEEHFLAMTAFTFFIFNVVDDQNYNDNVHHLLIVNGVD